MSLVACRSAAAVASCSAAESSADVSSGNRRATAASNASSGVPAVIIGTMRAAIEAMSVLVGVFIFCSALPVPTSLPSSPLATSRFGLGIDQSPTKTVDVLVGEGQPRHLVAIGRVLGLLDEY